MTKASVTKATQRKAGVEERRAARAASKATRDSFQNFALKLGMGTDNALSGSTYGFNPVTRIRTLLEWIYRGSWMGGIAVDIIAEDMTRAGIVINSQMKPRELDRLKKAETHNDVWGKIQQTIKWSRLYGGAIAVMLIDGADMATPLRPELTMPGQFKGLYVLDRWMVDPDLTHLVSELGPDLGVPEFYKVSADAPALRGRKIHYSRVLRMAGIDLPYWQRVQENLWGISVFERIYDRMIALDSSTQGAAQLVYKSYIRTYKMKGYSELMSTAGDIGIQTLMRKMDMTRRFMSNEGMTVIDADDDMVVQTSNGYAGISDVILQMAQQLSGTLQIPLVRMYGQSPAGLNSTGESDIRMYEDGINQQQERQIRRPVDTIYRVMAASEGIVLDPDWSFNFESLHELSDTEKSEVADKDTKSLLEVREAGVTGVGDAFVLKELRQNSKVTGRFDSITDEMIEAAEEADKAPDPLDVGPLGLSDDELLAAGRDPTTVRHDNPHNPPPALTPPKPSPSMDKRRTFDTLPSYVVCGMMVAIENMKGTVRFGPGWARRMPADYGHIPTVPSAEGDMEWLDAFVGPNRESEQVWIVDTLDPRTGKFDEHKCMMGFDDEGEAMACFKHAYHDDGKNRVGGVTLMDRERFAAWCASGDKTRPVQRLRSVS